MKSINTLIPDIYSLVKRKDGWFTDELAADLGKEVGLRLQKQLSTVHHSVGHKREYLWFGELGPQCPCALWHRYNAPELAEPTHPWVTIKYSYGHILEALVIVLAKAAGHEVTGEQDVLELDGVRGHRDCVIDGVTVDVKSSSSRSFGKFRTGEIETSDNFGYLDQLAGYLLAADNDPLVLVKNRGCLLAIDKQNGHMCLHAHDVSQERAETLKARIKTYKDIVSLASPPQCTCKSVPEGASGNMRLDTRASYSPFKFCCHTQLRVFIYANGPVYLTKVVRKPDVREVNKHGNTVYR